MHRQRRRPEIKSKCGGRKEGMRWKTTRGGLHLLLYCTKLVCCTVGSAASHSVKNCKCGSSGQRVQVPHWLRLWQGDDEAVNKVVQYPACAHPWCTCRSVAMVASQVAIHLLSIPLLVLYVVANNGACNSCQCPCEWSLFSTTRAVYLSWLYSNVAVLAIE